MCNLVAHANVEQEPADAFRLLQHHTMDIGHRRVERHRSITLKDIRDRGCNSPAKVIHRLRKLGVVMPKSADTRECSRKGRYQRYWRILRMVG